MKAFCVDDYLPHLSIDCVIFGYAAPSLKVLVSKFKYGQNNWGLPGGYVQKSESIDTAARRILKERTGLDKIYLDQFKVFGDKGRIADSAFKEVIKKDLGQYDAENFDAATLAWITDRFVCIGYYAVVDISKVQLQKGAMEEQLEWTCINKLPALTYDHNAIVATALQALRQNLDQKLIGFNLLPATFTMQEVQGLYEVVYNRPFARNNFQKKILSLDVLERLEKKFTGAANKAPYLYRFKQSPIV
jgi:8-oxo-dGTP diphosphatase